MHDFGQRDQDALLVKRSTTGADTELCIGLRSRRNPAPRTAPSIIRRRRPATIVLTLLLVALRLALLISGPTGSSLFHPQPYPSCGSASFEPPQSRQGLCTVYGQSSIVVRNIVDRNSTLHMPEYDARVLTWNDATHVPNWRNEPKRFPEGHGALVSLEVEVSNPGNEPLQYGPLIAR